MPKHDELKNSRTRETRESRKMPPLRRAHKSDTRRRILIAVLIACVLVVWAMMFLAPGADLY